MAKDTRLTPKQIEKLLNNPKKLIIEQPKESEPVSPSTIINSSSKEYDSLNSIEQVRIFCSFIKELIAHYEENQRQQEEAEIMESDLKHAMELTPKLTEKEKKLLYQKLTEVLQTRRACKSENEILQPFYNYFNDKVLLNKLAQLQGTVASIKEIVSNRTYYCRTSVLDDIKLNAIP